MAYTVDSLQVEIATQSGKAVNGLRTLTTALQNLKSVTKVSLPSKLAENIKGIGDALKGISNEDIEKLEHISNALQTFSDVKSNLGLPKLNINVKEVSKVSNEVDKVAKKATQITRMSQEEKENLEEFKNQINSIKTDTTQVSDLANILSAQAFKANPLMAGINKTVDSIKGKIKIIKKLTDALGRVAFYRAIRTALKEITDAFSEGLKNAYAFSKQDESFKRLADALDRIASVASQMRNQLGAMLGEIITTFAPTIERLVNKITTVGSYLTELFAALSGQDTYLQAVLVSKAWDDATDSAKKYKQQLLGIDEINNLSAQSSGGNTANTDVSKEFVRKNVSDKLMWLGNFKLSIKDILFDWDMSGDDILGEITDKLNMLVGGAIGFMFGGVGGALVGTIAAVAITALIKSFKMKQAEDAKVGIKTLGLKTVLSGIAGGLIGFKFGGLGGAVMGATLSMSITSLISALKMKNETTEDASSIATMISSVLTSIAGATIGFKVGGVGGALIGASIGLALGLLVNTLKFDDKSRDDAQSIVRKVLSVLNHAVSGLVGAVIGFNLAGVSGAVIGLSLGVSLSLMVTSVEFVNKIKEKVSEIADTFVNDNFGQVTTKSGATINLSPTQDIAKTISNAVNKTPGEKAKKIFQSTVDDAKRFIDDIGNDFKRSALGQIFGYAGGGLPSQGTLFYAGESGPEFVGNMGGQTAVANTDQMGDAIRQAAYEGMSQALREHGGTVVLSPDADKIFNITKEKGREYTRMTGQSWAY